ncbi:hypothetical protein JTE90_012895 [Oedothorax gibbosus]|uniref:Uncharacterized protein n=1 Tax=Oedothorax gibbosus TaxID=931172 RepID=A0AAV6TM84_9ARAC|nr:hypothetical protein JTE90_012895 [Oedothorax gibbosus]
MHVQHVQNNYAAGNIRPQLVWDAAQRLSSSPLYEEYGIGLCSSWMDDVNDFSIAFEFEDKEFLDNFFDFENQEENDKEQTVWPEDEITDCNPGGIETLISGEEGLRMAPAEGYRPISVLNR